MQTNRWAAIPLPSGTGTPVKVTTPQTPVKTPVDRSAATGKIPLLVHFRKGV